VIFRLQRRHWCSAA